MSQRKGIEKWTDWSAHFSLPRRRFPFACLIMLEAHLPFYDLHISSLTLNFIMRKHSHNVSTIADNDGFECLCECTHPLFAPRPFLIRRWNRTLRHFPPLPLERRDVGEYVPVGLGPKGV